SSTTNALSSSRLNNPRQIHSFKEVLVSSVLESVMPSTDDILAATAHELRLPLSHIKGFVTSLRRTDVEWYDETRKEFIAEIDMETDRLAEVVETLCTPWSAAGRGSTRGAQRSVGPPRGAQRSVGWLLTHRTAATKQMRTAASHIPPRSSRAHCTVFAVCLTGGRCGSTSHHACSRYGWRRARWSGCSRISSRTQSSTRQQALRSVCRLT